MSQYTAEKEGDTMTVIINKLTRSGVKTISGTLISNGLGVITALIYDAKGSSSIKRFKKENIANYQIID